MTSNVRNNSDVAAIEYDLEDAAAMMLLRACRNFEDIGLKTTPRIKRFNTWFCEWATCPKVVQACRRQRTRHKVGGCAK